MSSDRFDRLEAKMEELKDSQTDMNQHLAVYNEQLKIHIKGTEENRDSIIKLTDRFIPVEDHVKFIKRLLKLFAAALATALVIFQILDYLK